MLAPEGSGPYEAMYALLTYAALPGTAKGVLLVIAKHCPTPFCSYSTISRESGYSPSTVADTLSKLREIGILLWRTGSAHLVESNLYSIQWAKIPQLAPQDARSYNAQLRQASKALSQRNPGAAARERSGTPAARERERFEQAAANRNLIGTYSGPVREQNATSAEPSPTDGDEIQNREVTNEASATNGAPTALPPHAVLMTQARQIKRLNPNFSNLQVGETLSMMYPGRNFRMGDEKKPREGKSK